jgi:signal transduction histidine kinase
MAGHQASVEHGSHTTTKDDLLAALPDMIFRVGPGDVYLEFHGGERDLAVPPDQFLGRRVEEVLPGPLAELFREASARARQTGQLQVVEYELPPGSGHHFEARAVLAGQADVVYVVRNVTERRQAEAALRQALVDRAELERRLAQADRLSALGTLAAGVAHEINNPLTYVRGSLELVAEAVAAVGLASQTSMGLLEALEDARGGVERIRRAVQGLQAFAAPQGRARTTLALPALAEKAAALVMNEVRHRARFVLQDEGAPPVHADEGGLVQVLVNLLLNAAQAIRPGHQAENEIRVVVRAVDGRAVVEVRDSGEGIPPEHLSRIFDPFFTTREPGVGSGLGLSICHAITRAHEGTLAVESAPGQGTVVRLSLPAAPRPEQAPAASAPAVRPRVLVVDDEPRVLATTARLLRGEFEVEVEGDGRAALERIRAGARYDAILCDLMMPNLTGMAFHQALASQAPDLAPRCAFLTGGAFTEEARRFLEALPDRTMEKPFEVEALRAMVRRLASGPAGRA